MGSYVYISLLVRIFIEMLGGSALAVAAWFDADDLKSIIIGLVIWWFTTFLLTPLLLTPLIESARFGTYQGRSNTMKGATTTRPAPRYHAGRQGTGRGEDEVPDGRVTLREAAEREGVSEGAIRKRVKRGTLRSELGEDGRRYVFLDGGDDGDGRGADGGVDAGADALVSELRDQIGYLRSQLDHEREANRENRRIIAALTSRIPEIEAPPSQETRESTVTLSEEPEGGEPRSGTEGAQDGAESRSWWRRVFG